MTSGRWVHLHSTAQALLVHPLSRTGAHLFKYGVQGGGHLLHRDPNDHDGINLLKVVSTFLAIRASSARVRDGWVSTYVPTYLPTYCIGWFRYQVLSVWANYKQTLLSPKNTVHSSA